MNSLRKRAGAFTLIELLIVITIIGILAVALVPRLSGGVPRARDAQRKADVQQVATALEFYNDDKGYYPGAAECVNDMTGDPLANYLTTIPEDPNPDEDAWTDSNGCTGGDYLYQPLEVNADSEADGYLLIVNIENAEDESANVYSSSFSVDVNEDASTNLSDNESNLCSDSSVTCTSPIYVIGR